MQTYLRRWFSPPPRRRKGKGRGLLVSSAVGVALALALIFYLEAQLTPVLAAMATAKVTNAVTQTLDGAIAAQVEESGLSYSDIITMEKDGSGRITALTSNVGALNRLRTGILGTAVSAVDRMDAEALAIPVGNLSGVNFLSGRGFSLPVEVVSVGTAHAEFEN